MLNYSELLSRYNRYLDDFEPTEDKPYPISWDEWIDDYCCYLDI